jgi:hypothetical protein
VKDKELHWTKLGSEAGPEIPLFGVRLDRMQHPTSSAEFERLVFESSDWVNVVAITKDGEIAIKFRHNCADRIAAAATLNPRCS